MRATTAHHRTAATNPQTLRISGEWIFSRLPRAAIPSASPAIGMGTLLSNDLIKTTPFLCDQGASALCWAQCIRSLEACKIISINTSPSLRLSIADKCVSIGHRAASAIQALARVRRTFKLFLQEAMS